MIHLRKVTCLLIASLSLIGCVDALRSRQPPQKWSTGFWFWQGNTTGGAWSGDPLDVLFIQAGTIDKDSSVTPKWRVYGSLPDDFPDAREYWIVYRYERQGVPDLQAATILAREVSQTLAAMRKSNHNVAGVQLDIDSPTGSLTKYATFLREFRKGIPKDSQISITALLDWFRPHTDIGEVIKEVDEFVPQFYDTAERDRYGGGSAIAAKIDAMKWGPVFNRFRKRFRVGISTFGRSIMVAADGRSARAYYSRDVAPIDIAMNSAFQLQTARNQANELLLNYRAVRKVRIAYNDFAPGDTMQFILSTPESIAAATESAHQMRGYLAGVVFFRWSDSTTRLSMQPQEVLIAAGLTTRKVPSSNRILAIDGGCAAMSCADIYIESVKPFSPKPVQYHIRSSTELAYFLPEKNLPARMTGPSQIELSLPPFCARGRLYLGRAVTAKQAAFTVEEER